MPDDRAIRGPQDASRINTQEAYELEYWTDRLNVSPEDLKAAVNAVGPSVLAVQLHLEEKRKKRPSRPSGSRS